MVDLRHARMSPRRAGVLALASAFLLLSALPFLALPVQAAPAGCDDGVGVPGAVLGGKPDRAAGQSGEGRDVPGDHADAGRGHDKGVARQGEGHRGGPDGTPGGANGGGSGADRGSHAGGNSDGHAGGQDGGSSASHGGGQSGDGVGNAGGNGGGNGAGNGGGDANGNGGGNAGGNGAGSNGGDAGGNGGGNAGGNGGGNAGGNGAGSNGGDAGGNGGGNAGGNSGGNGGGGTEGNGQGRRSESFAAKPETVGPGCSVPSGTAGADKGKSGDTPASQSKADKASKQERQAAIVPGPAPKGRDVSESRRDAAPAIVVAGPPPASGGAPPVAAPPAAFVAPLVPLAASAAALYSMAPATAAATSIPAALETVAQRAGPALRTAVEAMSPLLAGRRIVTRPKRIPPRHEHLEVLELPAFPPLEGSAWVAPSAAKPVIRLEVDLSPFPSVDGREPQVRAVILPPPGAEPELVPFEPVPAPTGRGTPAFAATPAPPRPTRPAQADFALEPFPLLGPARPAQEAIVGLRHHAPRLEPFEPLPGKTWEPTTRPPPRRSSKVQIAPFPPPPATGSEASRTVRAIHGAQAPHAAPQPAAAQAREGHPALRYKPADELQVVGDGEAPKAEGAQAHAPTQRR